MVLFSDSRNHSFAKKMEFYKPKLDENMNYIKVINMINIYIFLFGVTAPGGPGPPHSRGF